VPESPAPAQPAVPCECREGRSVKESRLWPRQRAGRAGRHARHRTHEARGLRNTRAYQSEPSPSPLDPIGILWAQKAAVPSWASGLNQVLCSQAAACTHQVMRGRARSRAPVTAHSRDPAHSSLQVESSGTSRAVSSSSLDRCRVCGTGRQAPRAHGGGISTRNLARSTARHTRMQPHELHPQIIVWTSSGQG
jgi:hypothetical protein